MVFELCVVIMFVFDLENDVDCIFCCGVFEFVGDWYNVGGMVDIG